MAARQRFLVTGGAGFIGRHLTAALVAEGHRVRVIDDLSRSERSAVPDGCDWIAGSLADPELCREACEGIDGVFHLAAAIDTPPSVEPVGYFMGANVESTRNVLLAARDAHVQKVVYAGSRTAYGAAPAPHAPTDPPDCLTPYALSKLVGEQLCQLFTRLYGLPTISLRYADVYGAGQPRTGPYALVIADLLAQRSAGLEPAFQGDWSQAFDFIHVSDAVDASLRAYWSSASGSVLDVGSGVAHSVKSIVDLFTPEGSGEVAPVPAGDLRGESIERTGLRIQWSPRISLVDGLHALIATLPAPPHAAAAD